MNPGNYSDRLLEGRLTREQFDTIARAATAGWDPAYAADPANAAAVEDVVFRRHDNALKFVVPWVQDIRPLGGSKVIDFGSGCGSSALAFSYYARAVEGFEIDQPSVDAFRARMDVFGVANAKVQLAGPEEILEGALAAVEPGTTFVFLAVVEHLLEEERISYLRAAWNALHPGDLLVIAETPNYYAYFDGHTFGVPFASMVPDPYFERWLVQQGDGLRFGKDLRVLAETQGIEAALTQRRRLGLGVTHHTFELAFEQDLNEIVVADAFQPPIVDWFPMSVDDRSLLTAFREYNIELPVGFARSVLSLAFRKPSSEAQVRDTVRRNSEWRNEVIDRLAFTL